MSNREHIYGAHRWADISASDTALFTETPRAIFVTVAGDAALVGSDGVAVTFTLAAGLHPLQPRGVKSSGLTATLKALF